MGQCVDQSYSNFFPLRPILHFVENVHPNDPPPPAKAKHAQRKAKEISNILNHSYNCDLTSYNYHLNHFSVKFYTS